MYQLSFLYVGTPIHDIKFFVFIQLDLGLHLSQLIQLNFFEIDLVSTCIRTSIKGDLSFRPIDASIVVPEPVESDEEFRIAYLCDCKGYPFRVVEDRHPHVDVVGYLSHGVQASICIVDWQGNLEFLCGDVMLFDQIDVNAGSSTPAVNEACYGKLFYHVLGLEYDRDNQLVAFTPSDVSLLSAKFFNGFLQLFFV